MANYTFDLKHTNIAKGFFVMAMVLHHVFSSDMSVMISQIAHNTLSLWLTRVACYGKVCIGGFVFFSAYGITKKIMQPQSKTETIMITRLIKLYFAFWPIYIFGIIGTVIFGERSITEIYTSNATNEFSWMLPIVDMMGIPTLFNLNTLNVTWWYITIAIFTIFITPAMYYLYRKYKYGFVIVAIAILCITGISQNNNIWIIIILGVVFAKEDLLVSIKEKLCLNKKRRFSGYILIFLSLYASYELSNVASVVMVLPFATLVCVVFCYIVLADIPILSKILEFFGKHSANIYYIHTFLYYYWFSYTIYSLSNLALIYSVVFFGSLMLSVFLELGKKIVRYNKLEKYVISRLTRS